MASLSNLVNASSLSSGHASASYSIGNNHNKHWNMASDDNNSKLVFNSPEDADNKLYIIDCAEFSHKPIKINDTLFVTESKDLKSVAEIKEYVLSQMVDSAPELVIKFGHSFDLVKTEFRLELRSV